MTNVNQSSIYGPKAYNSSSIPEQRLPIENHIGALSQPLPWGDPQEILPIGFSGEVTPDILKRDEERERLEPGYSLRLQDKLNAVFNHQRFRFTPLQGWTQLWVYMKGLGKGIFVIVTFTLFVTFWLALSLDEGPFSGTAESFLSLWAWAGGVPAACWLIGSLVLKYVPQKYLLRTSRKGPIWEMNRQTGMVTIFARKKGQFRKLGIEGDFVAPFYEFYAAIHTIPDRQGFPKHMLNLIHRYEGLGIDFSVLMGKVSRQQSCMALWDFWQRYMDVSQPIPDLPELEVFRHLDPTTAERDKRAGRPERYWRDMDMKTFKAKIDEITDVTKVSMDRPNHIERYVRTA